MKTTLILAAASVVGALALATGAAGASSITNGSFETGDTTGWTGSGSVNIVNGGTAGSWYAQLVAGSKGVYTTLSQTFTADAGATLTGQSNFLTSETQGDACTGGFDDDGAVLILQGSTVIATPYARDACGITSGTQTGAWAGWTWTAPATGTYTILARVENVGDSDPLGASYLGLDAVTFAVATPPPPPPPPANTPASKGDCTANNWKSFTRSDGTPFKNTGDCLAYVKGK